MSVQGLNPCPGKRYLKEKQIMSNKTFLILLTIFLGLFPCLSLTMAQVGNDTLPVDILNDAEGWHIEPCPLPGYAGCIWRIRNLSADTVCAHIMMVVEEKQQYWYTLAPTDSADHLIGQWDCAIDVYLGECPGDDHLTWCERPCGPSLSQWGVIGLVLSLILVTIWIMLKRKKELSEIV
jgi:hypothetical protein